METEPRERLRCHTLQVFPGRRTVTLWEIPSGRLRYRTRPDRRGSVKIP
jgi:hypothetical protein